MKTYSDCTIKINKFVKEVSLLFLSKLFGADVSHYYFHFSLKCGDS